MKTKRFFLVSLFSGRRSGRYGNALNLLDWGQPPNANRSFLYWMSLFVAILAHGGLLAYLIGFAHLPAGTGAADVPFLIPVEITGEAVAPAAKKADREDLPSAQPRDVAQGAPPPAALGETAAEGFAEDLPEDGGVPRRGPETGSARSYTGWEVSALPEDSLTTATPAPPMDDADSFAISIPAKNLPEDRAVRAATAVAPPPAEKKSPRWQASDSAAGIARKIAEARDVPPIRSAPAPKPDAAPEELIIAEGERMTALLPEDAERFSGFRSAESQAKRSRADADHTRETLTGGPENAAAALAVPLPARKIASAADLLLNDETGSAAGDDRHENAVHHANRSAAAVYRAKVRAHLAAHKPTGGLGSGLVVVGFTLSQSGKLTAARILRSSGKSSLDESVLDALRRSAPFPKPPHGLGFAQLRFAVPFRFE